jgi:transposase-like protein
MQEMTKAHIAGYSLDMIADMRDWELSRLQIVTEVLRDKVREAYKEGVGVTELAKKAGVTRRTIHQWLE